MRRNPKGKRKQVLTSLGLVLAFFLSACLTYGPQYWDRIPTWDRVYAACGLADPYPAREDYPFVACFLDVGQGDAILLFTENATVLIDSGPEGCADIICKELNRMGVMELDLCIASHPHDDHVGSMAEVMRRIPTDHLILHGPSEKYQDNTYYRGLEETARRMGTPISYVAAGNRFQIETMKFTVLGPTFFWEGDLNNNSLVFMVEVEGQKLLLTGDAGVEEERAILESQKEVKADLLKVGHHGSNSATSPQWIEAVNPSYAVISCGAGNRYGHPHAETLSTLNERAVLLFRTDHSGTLYFVLEKKGLKPYNYAKNA